MYSLNLKDNNNTCHTAQRWRGEGWKNPTKIRQSIFYFFTQWEEINTR
jgi:hypothetical protein